MESADNYQKLSPADKRDIVFQALSQINPVTAGLATAYYAKQQEIRLKRLEHFIRNVQSDIRETEKFVSEVANQHNPEEFFALYELLLNKVMDEPIAKKRNYFRTYHYGMMTHPINGDYDEKRFFLDVLAGMTLVECEVLAEIYRQNSPVKLTNLEGKVDDKYSLLGIMYRLRSYGFIYYLPTMILDSGILKTKDLIDKALDVTFNDFITISSFGAKFGAFCLVGDISPSTR